MQIRRWLNSVGWLDAGVVALVLVALTVGTINSRKEEDLKRSIKEYWDRCTNIDPSLDDEDYEAVVTACGAFRDSVIEDHGASSFLEELYREHGAWSAKHAARNLWWDEYAKETLTKGESKAQEYQLLLKRYEALNQKEIEDRRVEQAEEELRELRRESAG